MAFVVDNGFGEFSTRPKKIARTVSSWLKDDELLRAKSGAALQVPYLVFDVWNGWCVVHRMMSADVKSPEIMLLWPGRLAERDTSNCNRLT